tara:strand:+ start:594 stop:2693 length:2100 start_codon:yes stop_codon:yes gene_type:complete
MSNKRLTSHLKGDASTSVPPGADQSWSSGNPGPYVGIVKGNVDPTKMGRLKVSIPALSKTESPNYNQLYTVEYLSPFYGAKSDKYNKAHSRTYDGTQHSYGFWAIPPDLESKVLVIFAEGKISQGYWIGCIQDPYTNHMIPGIASSENTIDKTTGLDTNNPNEMKNASVDKMTTYGTKNVPAGEINRASPNALAGNNYERIPKPIHPFADILKAQGLISDTIRGTTTSSARRETPSQVFGISTPGKKNTGTTKEKVGTKDTTLTDYVVRETGHTFVMDDGDINGNNQLTRLRTASGHQLLMHDTAGIVYIANGSGKSWIEMSTEGKIYIYAQDGFNLRADGNFDLHSGGDINFHAKNSIKFTAEAELVNNAKFIMNIGEEGVFTTSQNGSIMDYGSQGISSYTNAQQMHGAGGQIHLAGAQVHFNSVGASSSWGPTWLNPKAAGITENVGELDLDINNPNEMKMKNKESGNDVNLMVGQGGILEANTARTKTTVPNLVTHEPFTRAPSGVYETVSQWEDPVKWKQLSQTPGTLEFMAQQNRNSTIEYVKQLQFFTDQKKYLTDKGLLESKGVDINNPNEMKNLSKFNSLNLKKLSDTFTKNYNEIYKVKSVVENLKTTDIKQILTTKVVAGQITSVASKLTESIWRRSSADITNPNEMYNLPPSVRNVVGGHIMQVAKAFKASSVFQTASAVISKFKFW